MRRLMALEGEKSRLKKIVADLTLDRKMAALPNVARLEISASRP